MDQKKLWLRLRRLIVPVLVFGAIAVDFHGDPTQYFTYFTVLTNVSIAVWFLAAAIAPEKAERASVIRLALTIYGLITLSVYWILLSPTHHPQGALWVATMILHLIVPLAMAVEELIVPWPPTKAFVPLLCLLFPVAYSVFAVTRGELTGWYPYFFLDRGQVGGWGMLFVFLAALLLIFAVLSYAWRFLIHRRGRTRRRNTARRG